MFHQVNNNMALWDDKSCSITEDNFRSFIDSQEKNGAIFGSIYELDKALSNEMVCISIDDIYCDAFENAIPFLREKKIPYCVFIATDKLDKPKYISTQQLIRLAGDDLCTIGYHSKSHSMMRYINKDDIQKEIIPSYIEGLIGRKIDLFAYPYGSYYAVSKNNIRTISENGRYKMAFSTLRMEIDDKTFNKYRFFLPRININNDNYKRYT